MTLSEVSRKSHWGSHWGYWDPESQSIVFVYMSLEEAAALEDGPGDLLAPTWSLTSSTPVASYGEHFYHPVWESDPEEGGLTKVQEEKLKGIATELAKVVSFEERKFLIKLLEKGDEYFITTKKAEPPTRKMRAAAVSGTRPCYYCGKQTSTCNADNVWSCEIPCQV